MNTPTSSDSVPLSVIQPVSTTGYECGQGKCAGEISFTKCLACCDSKCSSDTKGCADFCLDEWGAKAAIKEMTVAATALQEGTISDPALAAFAVSMLEKMQTVRMERVRRVAIRLQKDTPGVRLMQPGS